MHAIRMGLVGINHKTADLALREAIARGAAHLNGEKPIFFPHPIVLLSTCNRTEIYFSAPDLSLAHSELLAYLRCFIDESFEQRLYSYFGTDCFHHLCRVTSGLDSAIFAESEIQRQVKQAYLTAQGKHLLTKCLHYSFQKALKVGKMVRTHLSPRGPTLYNALWLLAEWKQKKILLVGNSEINRGFASFLMHKGLSRFSIATQHPENLRFEEVYVRDRTVLARWQEYDIIVAASRSEDFLIRGIGSGQTIFDLSVPRNVDPEVGETTRLYNIEELNQMMQQDRTQEADCEEMVQQNAIRLASLYRLKIGVSGESGEGDDVADILHAGRE